MPLESLLEACNRVRNGFAPCRRASSERSVACCERPTEPLRTHGRSHSCRWRRWSLGPWASSTVRRHGTTPCPAFPCVTLLSLACPYVALGALWPAGAKGGFGSACLPLGVQPAASARAPDKLPVISTGTVPASTYVRHAIVHPSHKDTLFLRKHFPTLARIL